MKRLAIAFTAVLLPGALAAEAPVSLPGVSDEETKIPSGEITDYHRGNGDAIFVLHRTGRWYRVQLSDGCLDSAHSFERLEFERGIPGGSIDRFSTVRLSGTGIICAIESIRRSVAPPQIDSDSPIRLD